MSAREWQPGDVAMVTHQNDDMLNPLVTRGIRWRYGWLVSGADGYEIVHDRSCINAHALVVIDPSGIFPDLHESAAERVAKFLREIISSQWPRISGGNLHLERLADAFEVATAPPKPDEPGTWGVVDASCVHSDTRIKWVRHEDGNWWPATVYSKVPERTPLPDDWDSLIDPVVIREGVTP